MKSEMSAVQVPAYRSYQLKPLAAMVAWAVTHWSCFDQKGNQIRPLNY